MIEELSWISFYLSLYSIAIPVIVGLIRANQLAFIQRLLFALCVYGVLTEVLSRYEPLQNAQGIIFYCFTVVEFVILFEIFRRHLSSFLRRGVFQLLIALFSCAILVDIFWLSKNSNFNALSTAAEGLILIFLVLSFFYKTLVELKVKYLEREPLVWISIGLLLYFASSLFVFLFTNYVAASNEALFLIWGIHGIFSFLLNLFYSIALWVKMKS